MAVVANGPSKTMRLETFSSNFTGLAVSKLSRSLDFFFGKAKKVSKSRFFLLLLLFYFAFIMTASKRLALAFQIL